MKQRLSLVIGIFIIMALSNAIVPVLPEYADEMPALQGIIFSAYFFGAFVMVIPAGVLGDRYGRRPFIIAGLLLTVLSGGIILLVSNPYAVTVARIVEGIGAGLFVSCALSWVNIQPDHTRLSGLYFAALNAGLIAGLMGTGILNAHFGQNSGVMLFTGLVFIPLIFSFFLSDTKSEPTDNIPKIHTIGWRNRWLYFSSFILIGISGVLVSLYPEFTDESPFILGMLFATMNAATICSSLIAPHLSLQPIQTIRMASALVGMAVIFSFVAPVYVGIGGVFFLFMVIGASIGFVFVSQMNYLATSEKLQGTAIGLLTAASYGGMAVLPFISGILTEFISYAATFFVSGFFCLLVTVTIARCRCALPE
ncbi:MFS transporter [Methanogenium sp. MK-MG]|uniref:MFS transporter n=1 Tax=Methanogenium sp. MK-MG TaxID=2599926 RepID=UPI0013E9C916|nr:MFS transporter [Methanogenium sp. MK-MG]KAF1077262.1 hypothetical protein MKMG_01303 [Methanogenium sp. MK-MG]